MSKQFLVTFPALEDKKIDVAVYKVEADDAETATRVARAGFTISHPKRRIGTPVIATEHDEALSWSHVVIVPAVSPDTEAPRHTMLVTLDAHFVEAEDTKAARQKGLEHIRQNRLDWVPLGNSALIVTFDAFQKLSTGKDPYRLVEIKQNALAVFSDVVWPELKKVLTDMSDRLSTLTTPPVPEQLDRLDAQTARLEHLLNQLIQVKTPEVKPEDFSETVWYALQWSIMAIKLGLSAMRKPLSASEKQTRVERVQAQISLLQDVLQRTLDGEEKSRIEQHKIRFYPAAKEQIAPAHV